MRVAHYIDGTLGVPVGAPRNSAPVCLPGKGEAAVDQPLTMGWPYGRA